MAARHVTILPQNAKALGDGILAWAQESSNACVRVVTWVRRRRKSGKARRSTGKEAGDRGPAGPMSPFPVCNYVVKVDQSA